jgi:hypothetical protein
MELRIRELVANLFFFFLNDEWAMKGCEEGEVMMMVVRIGKGS